MLTTEDLIIATKGELINGKKDQLFKEYKIDSRVIEPGDFYFPLVGENVNGQKYIMSAIEKGCMGVVVKDMKYVDLGTIKEKYPSVVIIKVDDTKAAMMNIGTYNRIIKHPEMDVVTITGSAGKTSTREMVASILSECKDILVTEKNMNSHIGIPLMDLKMDKQDIAVLEAGVDFTGEMELLNKMLVPDVAVITNIGTSHIGKFGSQDAIYREKIHIAQGLRGKKVLVLNKDDKYLREYKNDNVNIKYYSMDDAKKIQIFEDRLEFDTNIYDKEYHIVINAIGNYNILNAIAGIRVADVYNLPAEKIVHGIASYKNFTRRMERINLKDIVIIDDTYNASPSSMESGLKSVNEIKAKRRIAVLADILELGDFAKELHSDIGNVFENLKYDIVIGYGEFTKYLLDTASKFVKEIYYTNNKEDSEQKLREIIQEGDLIYFKGSNGMKVNDIVENIKKDFMN